MTTNQKARELVERFGDNAEKVVHEIIKSGPTVPSELKDSYWIATESANKFWEDVKEEIKKL